jgi:hypothetical protein
MENDPVTGWMCMGTICAVALITVVTIAVVFIRENWNNK